MSSDAASVRTQQRLTGLLWKRQQGFASSSRTSDFQKKLDAASGWNIRRMENIILAVGPTTPAGILFPSPEHDELYEDAESLFFRDTDDSSSSSSAGSTGTSEDELWRATSEVSMGVDNNQPLDQSLMSQEDVESSSLASSSSLPPWINDRGTSFQQAPSIRTQHSPYQSGIFHNGCINTACWLDAPWRLACNYTETTSCSTPNICMDTPHEASTQIMTSGDDRMLKIWDVTQSIGMVSPIGGGWDTYAPLADSSTITSEYNPNEHKQRIVQFYRHQQRSKVPGQVRLLASISTGHVNNVFHVSPIRQKPGEVLTCGADGYLRLIDIEMGQSCTVLAPVDDEMLPEMWQTTASKVAYSHVSLGPHTGLLCSAKGLRYFDIRLSVREQSRRSILPPFSGNDAQCKACAIWSPRGLSEDSESYYVLAGGASATFGLYDLRMDGTRCEPVCRYSPQYDTPNDFLDASVSGLEVSKDGRDVLVSYENDQVYTFPIFPCLPSSVPSLEQIEDLKAQHADPKNLVNASAVFVGHLNRHTFLKSARFAGPNDEYVCTGSDSGHAWIYERRTGTVAAILSADKATCNGICPHPTLPLFLTYGIASSAKLWKTSTPVNLLDDDSATGRFKAHQKKEYFNSPVVRDWRYTELLVRKFSPSSSPATCATLTPDNTLTKNEQLCCLPFYNTQAPDKTAISRVMKAPQLGNALARLPDILRRNCFQVYLEATDSPPVYMPIGHFRNKISLSRLRFQARCLGTSWDRSCPWYSKQASGHLVQNVDLLPDFPSDWLVFDKRVAKNTVGELDPFRKDFEIQAESQIEWLDTSIGHNVPEMDGPCEPHYYYQTALLCKNKGNEALEQGNFHLAARRYDKCIQYLSILFITGSQVGGGMSQWPHLTSTHPESLVPSKADEQLPLLSKEKKLLISCHLNIALVCMKKELNDPGLAVINSERALELLEPHFSSGDLFSDCAESSKEVYKLLVKAYFRHGTALLQLEMYDAAISAFRASKRFSEAIVQKVDPLLTKRLVFAKRKAKALKREYGAKFRRLMEENSRSDP